MSDRGPLPVGGPLATIEADRLVAVIRAPSIGDPSGLVESLLSAGIRAIEFTLTARGAMNAIRETASSGAVVGAGTVLTRTEAEAAIGAGAQFLVSPGLVPETLDAAREAEVPMIPGAFTPSEVLNALGLGAPAVKLFPARLATPAYVVDLLSVFPGLKIIPSGGINDRNARTLLDAGAVALSAGTDIAPPELVAGGAEDDHKSIAARAQNLLDAVRRSTE